MTWRNARAGALELVTEDGEVLGSVKPNTDECGLRWRSVAIIHGSPRTIGRRPTVREVARLVEEKIANIA